MAGCEFLKSGFSDSRIQAHVSLSYISVWDTALEKGASVFMEALPHTPPHPTPWGLGNLGGFSILHSKVFPGRVSNYPIQPISKTNNFKWGAYVCRGWGVGRGYFFPPQLTLCTPSLHLFVSENQFICG